MKPGIRIATALVVALVLPGPALAADVTFTLDAADGFVIENNPGTVERLRVDEATGNVSRNGALFIHTTGTDNTFIGEGAGNLATTGIGGNSAFGRNALSSNPTGFWNSALGSDALYLNTTGFGNSAVGNGALYSNTSGQVNSALGVTALYSNTTGYSNTAFGGRALFTNTVGNANAAFGAAALYNNTSGNRNVAVGHGAGFNATTGSDNIYLANSGVAAESGQIKIGTSGTHTAAHIAGIYSSTSSGGIAVYVNSAGTLGTTTSSARFKKNVRDLGEASDVLMRLRPVAFQYQDEVVEEGGEGIPQVGLIAEEVAEVAPELVSFGDDGQPYTVRYRMLAPMLLNEMKKQQQVIERQAEQLSAHEDRLARDRSQLAALQEWVCGNHPAAEPCL